MNTVLDERLQAVLMRLVTLSSAVKDDVKQQQQADQVNRLGQLQASAASAPSAAGSRGTKITAAMESEASVDRKPIQPVPTGPETGVDRICRCVTFRACRFVSC